MNTEIWPWHSTHSRGLVVQQKAVECEPEGAEEWKSFTSYLSDSSFSLWGISFGLPRRDSCRKTQFRENQPSPHDHSFMTSDLFNHVTRQLSHEQSNILKQQKLTAVISMGLFNQNAITKEEESADRRYAANTISFISENFCFKKCFLQIRHIKCPVFIILSQWFIKMWDSSIWQSC